MRLGEIEQKLTEIQIEMLKMHLDDIEHNSDQKSSSTREDKSMEGQGVQRRGTF